jgi:hypothetical protein
VITKKHKPIIFTSSYKEGTNMTFRKFKKRTAIVVIACMIMTLVPGMVFGSEASDISGHWAEEKIQSWINQDLIKGYEDGTFKPDNNITRAEFMTLVNGAFQYTDKADIGFSDVAEDAWYAEAVQKAKAAGYISGYPDNTMRPDNPISREEAAAIIKGITQVEGNPEGKTSFTDQSSLSWSKDAVVAVSETEIMNGYPDGSFKPQNLIKRAEAVVALDTALNYSKSSVVYDKAGTYGPESGVLEVEGDLIVLAKDVELQNILIKGNLIISKNVGDGEVTLDNVTVKGESRIYGGGENSIIIINSTLGNVKVYKEDGKIRIVISGNTTVEGVTVNSGATLETEGLTGSNAGFQEIILEASEDDTIVLKGTFNQVEVKSAGIEVQVPSGTTVNNLVLNSAAEVTGTGTIDNAQVNADDVSFETEPKKVDTAPGVTDPVIQTPAPPVSGGGGGSSSPSTVPVSAISVTPETLTLTVGDTGTITATVLPAGATNKNVTWTSSDETIATVADGVVTPLTVGTTTITVTTADGSFTATTTVIVGDIVVDEPGNLQIAIEGADAGDTIAVAAGSYNEALTINQDLTLQGADGATLTGGTAITGGNVTIEGFTITTKGILASGVTGLTIQNNTFSNIRTAMEGSPGGSIIGLDVTSASGPILINNNEFSGIGNIDDTGTAIRMVGLSGATTITGNTIQDVTKNGINIYNYPDNGVGLTITGNAITNWDSDIDSAAVGGRAIRIDFNSKSGSATINNNTLTPPTYESVEPVDPEYVKITGYTGDEGSLITQLADENIWTDNPDFATVILVNSTNWGPASITKGGVTTYYDSIGAAVEEVGEGETITLLADASGDGVIAPENSSFTLDLGGHTYTVDGTLVGSTGTETNGFQLLKGSTITIKNGTITTPDENGAKILIQNYSDLTLNDVDLVGGSATGYVLSNNFGDTTLENGTTITAATGKFAFDVYYGLSAAYDAGVSVTIADTNVVITGAYEYGKAGRVTDENWYAKAKLIIPMDYSLTAPEGFVWVAEDDKEVLTKAAVVGDKANLSTALADNTITAIVLSADIVLDSTLDIADKTITLDLNGHKLSTPDASGAAAQTVLKITGASNVTIQGDGLIQSGTTSSNGNSGLYITPTIHINNDSSSLTIKNSAVIKGGDAINSYDTAPAIWGQNFNELTITGATIRGGDHIKKSGITIGYNNYSTAGHALALMPASGKTVNITNSTISGGNGINEGYEFNKEDQGYMQASGGQAFSMNQSNIINITDSIIEGGDSALHQGGHAIAVNSGVFNIINSNIVGGDGNTYWKYSVGKATSGNGTYNIDASSTTADGVNSNPQ